MYCPHAAYFKNETAKSPNSSLAGKSRSIISDFKQKYVECHILNIISHSVEEESSLCSAVSSTYTPVMHI